MKIINGTIASPLGFLADGIHVGLKKKNLDMGLLYSQTPANTAAVYTTNAFCAAPIIVTKKALEDGKLQAIIVNSGNANAVTGTQGLDNAATMQELTAKSLNLNSDAVAVASTGIIGHQLNMPLIEKGIQSFNITAGESENFAKAILTTDTGTKEIVAQEVIDGKTVTMAAVAKGSGMIHPNMATMLSFITTDAKIPSELLQELLKEVTDNSFNQITVDGDTSTNDMVIVMANGMAGNVELTKEHSEFEKFVKMFQVVAKKMAQEIAKDGEGATKLIEVQVNGARNEPAARMIAKKIVGSSLVKTAMFGADPNWGRIICAIGYSNADFTIDTVDIEIEGQMVLHQSTPVTFNEKTMQEHLLKDTIHIKVELHDGLASGTAWGCDLSYKYVEINALYHT